MGTSDLPILMVEGSPTASAENWAKNKAEDVWPLISVSVNRRSGKNIWDLHPSLFSEMNPLQSPYFWQRDCMKFAYLAKRNQDAGFTQPPYNKY